METEAENYVEEGSEPASGSQEQMSNGAMVEACVSSYVMETEAENDVEEDSKPAPKLPAPKLPEQRSNGTMVAVWGAMDISSFDRERCSQMTKEYGGRALGALGNVDIWM